MITCPQCKKDNPVQKFCGNCGTKLLVDGVQLSNSNKEETTSNNKYNLDKWSKAIIIFLLIWIIGDLVLSLFLGMLHVNFKYTGAICFVIALLVFLDIIAHKDKLDQVKEFKKTGNFNIKD